MRQICTRRAEALKEAAYLAAACARATAGAGRAARGRRARWAGWEQPVGAAGRATWAARREGGGTLVWSSRVMTSLTNATPCVAKDFNISFYV